MRTTLAAFAGVGALAAATGVLLAASSASAQQCPRYTHHHTYTVAGLGVAACALGPEPQCDPGPCDPTAAAPRD